MADEEGAGAFEAALAAHDAAVAARGLTVWVGGEPTFTDPASAQPEWLGDALGGDKQRRAEEMARRLVAAHPGAFILRTVGRQYPQEPRPRWSVGLYAERDGQPCYHGPADPLCGGRPSLIGSAHRLRDALASELSGGGLAVESFDTLLDDVASYRLLFAEPREVERLASLRASWEATALEGSDDAEPLVAELSRPPLGAGELPAGGAVDALASEGLFLLIVTGEPATEGEWVQLELPSFSATADFGRLLAALAVAGRQAELEGLVLTGHGPPVDGSVRWETLTPDPGVVEVNMAPAVDACSFYAAQRSVYEAAQAAGLSAERLHFNGEVADSGGGGHITLGGPTPQGSPFLRQTALLPRLIAYVVRHPSLSYLFCDRAGSSSQAPRVDEGSREALAELELALSLLARTAEVTPELLWRQLAPFLVDRFGNTHRAEINVEKLWNPLLGSRGQQGLVELRAFRMPPTPEHWAALAALWRALVAHLTLVEAPTRLHRFGEALHERYTLPFYLEHDLRLVLDELEGAGLGLQAALVDVLHDDVHRRIGIVELGGVTLELRRAVEPWPLVGDLSAQEGTSRIVDPSCQRVELRLRATAAGAEALLGGCAVAVCGHLVPLCEDVDPRSGERLFVTAIRYRAFVPPIALHPLLPAQSPLGLVVLAPAAGVAHRVTLHDWKPEGGVYEGLPADATEAARRRRERITVERCVAGETESLRNAPAEACSAHGLDLRWL